MSASNKNITDSEYSIMKILWDSGEKMTVSDVVSALSGNEWTPSTVSTFLQRLLKKGAVSCDKRGKTNLYYPAIAENDYNLNIPRYVDTFEEEELIDIDEVKKNIANIEAELAEVQAQMKKYMEELGL